MHNTLDSSVDNAAPATPIFMPKIKTAFPAIFKTFVPAATNIGSLALLSALKNAAPALNSARNGYETTVIRK